MLNSGCLFKSASEVIGVFCEFMLTLVWLTHSLKGNKLKW